MTFDLRTRRHRVTLTCATLGTAAVLALTAACTSSAPDTGGATDARASADSAVATSAPSAPGRSSVPDPLAGIGTVDAADLVTEKSIAACMKQRGFTYVPTPLVTQSDDSLRSLNTGPLSLLRTDTEIRSWRQKYGYGIVSQTLYPRDPQVAIAGLTGDVNPNETVFAALDPTRQAAYRFALGGATKTPPVRGIGRSADPDTKAYKSSCQGRADRTKPPADSSSDAQTVENKQKVAAFLNSPDVQRALTKYEKCLSRIGQKPDALSASYIMNAGSDAFNQAHPDPIEASSPNARELLSKEISAALDELQCRNPFAHLVQRKYAGIPDAILHNGSDGNG